MSDSELVFYGFCAGFFVAVVLIAWPFRVRPTQRAKAPNASTDEAERWTYAVIDDAAIYVGEAPKPLVSEQSLITAIAIRHNQPEARN